MAAVTSNMSKALTACFCCYLLDFTHPYYKFKAEDLPVRTRCPMVHVQSAPVETTAPELPRALEKAVVVTPVARPFVILKVLGLKIWG
jgi:hypothetical protein